MLAALIKRKSQLIILDRISLGGVKELEEIYE